jgi:hypothetical protein
MASMLLKRGCLVHAPRLQSPKHRIRKPKSPHYWVTQNNPKRKVIGVTLSLRLLHVCLTYTQLDTHLAYIRSTLRT